MSTRKCAMTSFETGLDIGMAFALANDLGLNMSKGHVGRIER